VANLRDLSLAAFGAELASDAPTPGGGSASALAGALAAGLVAMVARLTPDELAGVVEEADGLRTDLLRLVDEDAGAFDRVMAAFRQPKATPEEQAARSEAIQQGYRGAVEPPLGVCTDAVRVLELAAQVAERGNRNAVSDAGVAAHLAAAALEGAALNVRINLAAIKDEAFRAAAAERVEAAQAEGRTLRDGALAAVDAQLG
jgi:methenyltetrahydrofolate cyclohydrolase